MRTLASTLAPSFAVQRWIVFYALIAAAWVLLFASHLEFTRARLAVDAPFAPEFWRAMCATQPSFPAIVAMWSLMAVGMMAPAAVPMLRTYDDLVHAGAGTQTGFWSLLAGYLAVWLGFSLLAAGAQFGLQHAGLLAPDGSSTSRVFSAALLALAGLYQFSALKHACLRACRAPLTSFMGDWRPGWRYAFRKGVTEGAYCLGCCWALMALAFAAGVMNLMFMGLAMALMIAEKTALLGPRGSRALGAALCLASVFVLA